ncbi:ornithine cyclodeaminase family protein [Pengzhenrongella sp.]|uniref:ornithine cyclodeaminase family protein n=1 Tax=Pengzhenrongella sp. TaxID=2888820 RepID=UPI002F937EC8
MLLLSASDVRALVTMPQAVDASKEALRLHSRGRCDVPLRTALDVPTHDGRTLVMPAHVPDLDTVGIKIVSVFPRNAELAIASVPATIVLLDGTTGVVCAVMDGTYLTALRTGAVQGAGTDALARADARVGALIGTGGQAAQQLEAMLCVRAFDEVRVFSRNPERLAAFVASMRERLAGRYETRVVAASSSDAAVDGADVVTCVTTSALPVFDGRLAAAGAHVNGVGAFTPAMQELDSGLLARADVVVIDTAAALAEAGDLIAPIEAGLLDAGAILELGDVLTGAVAGRANADQLTVFKSVGSAVLDVVTAHKVYTAALTQGRGQKVDL